MQIQYIYLYIICVQILYIYTYACIQACIYVCSHDRADYAATGNRAKSWRRSIIKAYLLCHLGSRILSPME